MKGETSHPLHPFLAKVRLDSLSKEALRLAFPTKRNKSFKVNFLTNRILGAVRCKSACSLTRSGIGTFRKMPDWPIDSLVFGC